MIRDGNLGGWDIPIKGFEVLDVWFSARTYVIAYGEGGGLGREAPRSQIAFGGPFELVKPGGETVRLDGEGQWEHLVPLLALRRARIAGATATETGHLHISFESGASIHAGPDPQYENWEVSGPGRLILVAPPGGGDPRIAP